MNDFTIYPVLPLVNSTNVFSLHSDHIDHAQSKYLYLMLGICIVERVPNDPNHFLYKMLVARLRTAGFKYKEIQRVFKVSENTIRKWAKALNSGSGMRVARVFGIISNGKLNGEVQAFIKMRYRALKLEGKKDYRKIIREELLDEKDIAVSGEALRRIFRKGDDEDNDAKTSDSAGVDEVLDEPSSGDLTCMESIDDPASLPTDSENSAIPSNTENPQGIFPDVSVEGGESRKPFAEKPPSVLPALPTSGQRIPARQKQFHHVGLFLFLSNIHSVGARLGEGSAACLQLIAQLLLGAVNVEQGKLLSSQALRFMIGEIMDYSQGFRDKLDCYASREGITKLAITNLQLVGLQNALSLILYYDPHGKHYTGELPILKGWCGNLKDTAKVLYSDYIHSEDGFPLFMKHYDNFYDLRERIIFTLHEFASLFQIVPEMTIVIDRGIYGLATMQLFTAKGHKLITWEKGYNKDAWNADVSSESFTWKRPRNNDNDLKTYSFIYQEDTWTADPAFRRIITRATNPKGNTVEVSILSSDQSLTAERIIKLIFNRWIQENDFRYLIEHYGIDELDSRAAKAYNTETPVDDRMVESRALHALQKKRKKATETIKKLLLGKGKKLKTLMNSQAKRRAKSYAAVEAFLAETKVKQDEELLEKEVDKQLTKVKKKIGKHQQLTEKLERQLAEREAELDSEIKQTYQIKETLETEIETTTKDESRLAALVDERYMYLDTTRKAVMDMCRIISRNIFYLIMQEFRPIYQNFRDDHDFMRTLVDAPGTVSSTTDNIIIRLWPKPEYGSIQREKMEAFLEVIAVKTEKWISQENKKDIKVAIVLEQ